MNPPDPISSNQRFEQAWRAGRLVWIAGIVVIAGWFFQSTGDGRAALRLLGLAVLQFAAANLAVAFLLRYGR